MSLIVRELQKVWEAMRASMPQRRDMLQEVHIRNFWGIRDLRVPFGYPVPCWRGQTAAANPRCCSLVPARTGYRAGDRGSLSPAACFPISQTGKEARSPIPQRKRNWPFTTCTITSACPWPGSATNHGIAASWAARAARNRNATYTCAP